MNELLEAALKYAAHGWHVFPVKPGGKTPITTHGCKDATTDEAQIREWWASMPDANVAVACGKVSGIYVIDIDVEEDGSGDDGYKSLKDLPSLPATVMQHTPRGGCHAFYRSDDPPANRNGFLPGVDVRGDGYYVLLSPSVRSDGKAYAWMEGFDPWNTPLAEFPDFLRPVKEKRATPAPLPPVVSRGPVDDTQRRASLYLAQCDEAVQGMNGHNALFWACGAMTWGCEMSEDQAYNILAAEYNPRCTPPWDLGVAKDSKDFRRKVAESIKNPPNQPRGWILNDPTYASFNAANFMSPEEIQKLIAGSKGNDKRKELPNPKAEAIKNISEVLSNRYTGMVKEFNSEFDRRFWGEESELIFLTRPTGLLGQICGWINTTGHRDQPLLTLAASLTFLGALFGHKIEDEAGGCTNLYCMGIAPSSAGKANAMNQIRNLCDAAGCTDLLGGESVASDSAIEGRMAREPVTLFLWDEIGHTLIHVKSGKSGHLAQVVSLLMKLYSAAGSIFLGREFSDSERQRIIKKPCCCIYGTSTPERFTEGISAEELQDGWLSRCLVFMARDSGPKMRGRRKTPPPIEIVKQINGWWTRDTTGATDGKDVSQFVVGSGMGMTKAINPIVVSTTPEAEGRFIAFDDESTAQGAGNQIMVCILAKCEENARRIALILAASENYSSPVITQPIADYSCRLVKHLTQDFVKYIAPEITSGETELRKRQLIKIIESSGTEGILKGAITQKSRSLNARQRHELMQDLLEGGDITMEKELSGRGLRYWTVANYYLWQAQEGGDE